MLNRFRNRAHGFTLVELLVVIAIIGVLVALLLPAVQAAREAARRSQCSNNLKQMSLGLHNYHDVHGSFPPSCVKEKLQDGSGSAAATLWSAYLLPYIEQKPLYDSIQNLGSYGITWDDDGVNENALETVVEVYRCPSAPDADSYDDSGIDARRPSNYGVVASGTVGYNNSENNNHMDDGGMGHSRWNGPFHIQNRAFGFRDITDGTSNTVAIGERYRKVDMFKYWYIGTPDAQNEHSQFYGSTGIPLNSPDTSHTGYAGFHSEHPGGVQFAICDGSTRFVSENTHADIRKAIGTRNGGEVLQLP